MAKNKKANSKKIVAKAKKVPAKAKRSTAKKVATKKVAKKPTPKKPVAKKVIVKKSVAKKAVAKKVARKKIVEPIVKKVATAPKKIEKPAVKKVEKEIPIKITAPVVKKLSSPQLSVFPVMNQRPIAHKQVNVPAVKDERTRYSENELAEFDALINTKLNKAREEYRILKEALNRNNDEGTDSTSGGNTKVLEDGAETAEKENLSQLAGRQQKFIQNLENALVRIKNGTYGICSVTGKLIPKDRLIAVPHTTQSIEAKMMQKD